MRGCRYVVHAAGIIPGSGATEASFKRVNSDGTRNVISAAESSGIDRMVHVSTVNVLPIMPGKPVDEDAGPPEHPHPGYDESKLSAEQAVLEASRDQLNAVVVNPAVVFGPGLGASSRIIRAFVRGRLPFVPLPGRSMSMVYVDDVARGCLLALKNGVRGERYILSNPPITISDFIDELAAVSGRRRPRLSFPSWIAVLAIGALWLIRPVTRWTPPVTVAGVRHGGTLYDGTRAERDLGLEYTRLHDALSDTVRWIREDER
jgi:dihydroflavonol-4-reductase